MQVLWRFRVKISRHDFLALQTLLNEEIITSGKFQNKKIIEQLLLNGAIKKERHTPKREIISLLKAENLFLFLNNNNYNIYDTEEIGQYIKEIVDNKASRDLVQKWQDNTKATTSQSQKGLYLSAPQAIKIKVDDKPLEIVPREGLGYFLFHTQKIELSTETIIVGVENYQVIWFAQRYAHFFKTNVLFVFINPYMLEWIESLENEYIHFGDYDLAGINIYLNRVLPRLKKAYKHSLFIPNNIEDLIKNRGSIELYEQQTLYKNLSINDTQAQELKNIICKYKKSLEQEGIHLL